MLERARRNRKCQAIREMISETQLTPSNLIYPLFMKESGHNEEIQSMPGIMRWNSESLLKEVESCLELGLRSFVIFPCIDESKKDEIASESYNLNNAYLKMFRSIKNHFPEACLISDVAMDPYSSDGHDGLVKDGKILNDETLEILGKMTLAQAEAGVDIIAPSDMMDGRVGYLRQALDENGFTDVSIMAYTAKYASGFYGPFRDALNSAPKFGDKKTYQMDPRNRIEALREARLDVAEGADFIMVKPALSYLDVISDLKNNFDIPVAAYNVSGEYAMVKAAAQKGWIDEKKVIPEILLSIRRAGADVVLTYFAKQALSQRLI
jgi:porphobilinogen synthase